MKLCITFLQDISPENENMKYHDAKENSLADVMKRFYTESLLAL
jgi:hypothetical protein